MAATHSASRSPRTKSPHYRSPPTTSTANGTTPSTRTGQANKLQPCNSAAIPNQGSAVFAENDDVDTAATILSLESGTLAVVSNSRYNARGHDVRLEIHGSKDSVAAGVEPKWPIRSTEPGVAFPDGKPHFFFMDRFATRSARSSPRLPR